ncbi:MAG: hypothetical protein LUH51_04705, partial [Firmicutes bacterium]|nr:hypothetical protein [Bacillota bacterium]
YFCFVTMRIEVSKIGHLLRKIFEFLRFDQIRSENSVQIAGRGAKNRAAYAAARIEYGQL